MDEKATRLQDIMPDLLIDLGETKDAGAGMGLKELIDDAEKYLIKSGTSVADVQKFVLAIVKEVSQDTGIPTKDVFEIPDKDIEALYAIAFNLYEKGKYKEAANMFRLLIMLNHFEFKYIFGLAACMHMQEQFFLAATTYTLAATLNPAHAWSHFHAAECYMEMNDPVSTCVALGLAIDASGDNEDLAKLKERCTMTRERLLEKIHNMQQENH